MRDLRRGLDFGHFRHFVDISVIPVPVPEGVADIAPNFYQPQPESRHLVLVPHDICSQPGVQQLSEIFT